MLIIKKNQNVSKSVTKFYFHPCWHRTSRCSALFPQHSRDCFPLATRKQLVRENMQVLSTRNSQLLTNETSKPASGTFALATPTARGHRRPQTAAAANSRFTGQQWWTIARSRVWSLSLRGKNMNSFPLPGGSPRSCMQSNSRHVPDNDSGWPLLEGLHQQPGREERMGLGATGSVSQFHDSWPNHSFMYSYPDARNMLNMAKNTRSARWLGGPGILHHSWNDAVWPDLILLCPGRFVWFANLVEAGWLVSYLLVISGVIEFGPREATVEIAERK